MQALILAGGKGTRLRPYTSIMPKPLMPIGDMPILEILIRQLKEQGVDSIILAVGYLHHMIEAYFEDGKKFDIPITYSLENEPLGTAGPIKLVLKDLDENFLVLNGDLLTTINFSNLFNAHLEAKAAATIAAFKRTVDIDFGVLEINQKSELENYSEKPIFDFDVSMGINVFNKSAIEGIIEDLDYIDIPDLMMELNKEKKKIFCYQEDCDWLDIGRIEDYNTAVDIFESNKKSFLPES